MRHWLLKSEPDVFSLADLQARPGRTEPWNGVRNYLARNHLRAMAVGDIGCFYHSNCEVPGIVGLVEIVRAAYPDHTAWDPSSPYFDPKSNAHEPRWSMVDVRFLEEFARTVTLAEMRIHPSLSSLETARKGSRLSVHPVDPGHFNVIRRLGRSA